MNRREALKKLSLFGAASWIGLRPAGAADLSAGQDRADSAFTLNYAPHFGMFRNLAGPDLIDQVRFMAENGFHALEDNGMKGRSVDMQRRIAAEMERLDMRMGVFVAHTIGWAEPNLTTGDPSSLNHFLKEIRESIEVAKRVNARWMTVVPGRLDPRLEMEYQTAHVVEALRRASSLLEPHNLTIVIEPLNRLRDHPGQFLSKISQAYQICRAVNSPSCRILFDIYHQQITEGNLIPNIDHAWDQIGYFQVGDHPGRNEPTTGEINYRNVFAHIHRKGWDGIVGMEHGNSTEGRKGEQAVIDAYRSVDPV
ncbi:MAG: TIM barrel protein [Balneolaceae bacterium]|nr:TIM barrel protein [Balneolaceae bacterium]